MIAKSLSTSYLAGMAVALLTACNLAGSAPAEPVEPNTDALVRIALTQTAAASNGDSQVATFVAGTMAVLAPTTPPAAADTQAATATLEPAAPTISTSGIPIIHVSTNTNCRYGPGLVYDPPVNSLTVGETAQVFGRSPDGEYYFIDKGCYVWTNYVTVEAGDINSVPVYTPVPSPSPLPSGPWSGEWETQCGVSGCDIMNLTQKGNKVSGTFANAEGTISGTVSGNHLNGTWTRNGTSGSFDFWMTNNENRFRGNWNRVKEWCGSRDGAALPNPCGVASWYGTWETKCAGSNCGQITLSQNGTNVSGSYANGSGAVSGTVNGTVFSGTWTRGGSGTFTFYMLGNGSQFQGNWDGSNAWCAFRDGIGYPKPCLRN